MTKKSDYNNIRERCFQAGKSLQSLAVEAGLSKATVYNLCNGKRIIGANPKNSGCGFFQGLQSPAS